MPGARLLVELLKLFNGKNNGKIARACARLRRKSTAAKTRRIADSTSCAPRLYQARQGRMVLKQRFSRQQVDHYLCRSRR